MASASPDAMPAMTTTPPTMGYIGSTAGSGSRRTWPSTTPATRVNGGGERDGDTHRGIGRGQRTTDHCDATCHEKERARRSTDLVLGHRVSDGGKDDGEAHKTPGHMSDLPDLWHSGIGYRSGSSASMGHRRFTHVVTSPCRNFPVWLSGAAATASGVPVATTVPPLSPPSGPCR